MTNYSCAYSDMNTMELAPWIDELYFHCFYYVLCFEEAKECCIVEWYVSLVSIVFVKFSYHNLFMSLKKHLLCLLK